MKKKRSYPFNFWPCLDWFHCYYYQGLGNLKPGGFWLSIHSSMKINIWQLQWKIRMSQKISDCIAVSIPQVEERTCPKRIIVWCLFSQLNDDQRCTLFCILPSSKFWSKRFLSLDFLGHLILLWKFMQT